MSLIHKFFPFQTTHMAKAPKKSVEEVKVTPKASAKKAPAAKPAPVVDPATDLSNTSKKSIPPAETQSAWQRLSAKFGTGGSRWLALGGAAVALAIIIIGVGIALSSGSSDDETELVTNTAGYENVNVANIPFSPDLAGGNRYVHGHYYPLAVMIDNASPARPQSGLQAASVVYEALVEGGITRFMAIFDQGKVDQIGPVRSARPYYLSWLTEYDAAYAHAGGSPEALGDIQKNRIHDINGIGSAAGAFVRDRSRPASHNLYTTSFKMYTITQKQKLAYSDAVIEPWTFAQTGAVAPADVTAAKKVTFYFTGTTKSTKIVYTYDAAKGGWLRSQADAAHQDRLTKQQIVVKNLVIQTISNNISVGEKGRLTMTVTGTGTAKVFGAGTVQNATWKKAEKNSRTTFTDANGTAVVFQPGNTWIEVLPAGRTVVVE
jgi:hypothetical protein